MNQSEFNRALQKYHNRKKRVAAAALGEKLPEAPKAVDAGLPFLQSEPTPKKVKPVEQPRPKQPSLKILVSGPVEFELTVDYQGTLLGSQITKEYLSHAMKKALSVIGRVN